MYHIHRFIIEFAEPSPEQPIVAACANVRHLLNMDQVRATLHLVEKQHTLLSARIECIVLETDLTRIKP